jgi:hypothetical protein
MLLNYEPRAFVELIKRHNFRITGVAAKQFERAVPLLIDAVITHKLIQASDDQEGFGQVVKGLFPSGISNIVFDSELRTYGVGC